MPIPILLAIAAGLAGTVGAVKGIEGFADNSEANDLQEDAEELIEEARRSIEEAKDTTRSMITELGKQKLSASANALNGFVEQFSKIKDVRLTESAGLEELQRLHITSESLKEMSVTALEASDVLAGGLAGVGAGVLLGWGTYGGVMALGTASTGAAISALSGAAATNATLAWLGGGAIAAGGGGMAMGTAVLGGIVAGPALLIAGGIFSAKAKEKLENAKANLAEAERIAAELETAGVELAIISEDAGLMKELIESMANLMGTVNLELKEIVKSKTDWAKFTDQEKKKAAAAIKLAQVLKMLIDIPLLTEDGVLTKEIREFSEYVAVEEVTEEVERVFS